MGSRGARGAAVARIREATGALHRELEGLLEAYGFLRSVDGLADHLEATWLHWSNERVRLAGHPGLAAQVAERLADIQADLAFLGRRFGATAQSSCDPYTWAEALGSMYVVEGSRLGSRAVMQRLREHGVPTERLKFLGPGSVEIGLRWSTLCTELNRLSSADAAVASRSAAEHFCGLLAQHRLRLLEPSPFEPPVAK